MAIKPLHIAAWAALVLSVIGLTLLLWCNRVLYEHHRGWDGDVVDVSLDPGMSAGAIFRRLEQAGVLANPAVLSAWLRLSGGSESLHAGEYRFDRAISPVELLERLQSGDVLLYQVTLPEGLDIQEIADRFVAAGFGPLDELLDAFNDPGPIADLDELAEDLGGYLYPDTYSFARGTTAQSIAARLVQQFRDVTGPQWVERVAATGLTVREAVSLASMIEKETSLASERRRISMVFHNRLEKRMRMQCDPTVMYAIRRSGRPVAVLTRKDLEFDSPWNTYRVYGLPPGPICSPGQASLEAAIDPLEGDDLYFVANLEGGHSFSATLEAHLKAVARWRRYGRSSK